jgi:hypothetical protein
MGIDGRSQRVFPKPWTGLSAAGSSQTTAFLLDNGVYHEFTSVGSGQGCVLPTPVELPREITISNNGAKALLVYPQVGGTIDNGSANASVSVAAGNSVTYWPTSFTNWQSRVTGGSGGGGGSSTITEVSQTASFTASAGSFYAISGSANVTATLPTAVGIAGQTIRVRCVSGYTGLCTITGTGGQTVSGATSQIIYAGESPLLQSDGTNWVRTGGLIIPSRAQILLGSNQTLTNNTTTIVQLTTSGFDNTGQMVNITSGGINILRHGQYRISISGYIGNISSALTDIYQATLQAHQNGIGTNATAQVVIPGPNQTFSFVLTATGTTTCAAGDLITMAALVAHAGGQAIPMNSGNPTYLEVEEIPSW